MSRLGALAGLRSEARCLTPFGIEVALSGARAEGARRAAAKLIDAGATHLLSFGLAGGLDPQHLAGTLLLPKTLLAPDGQFFEVDRAWHVRAHDALRDLDPVAGLHLGVDDAVADSIAKAELFRRSGAAALDMESHILAEAAAARGLPLLIVRVVCDTGAEALPPAALVSVTEAGGTHYGALLGSLIRHPGQLAALARLSRAAGKAQAMLLGCGRRLGPIGFGMG